MRRPSCIRIVFSEKSICVTTCQRGNITDVREMALKMRRGMARGGVPVATEFFFYENETSSSFCEIQKTRAPAKAAQNRIARRRSPHNTELRLSEGHKQFPLATRKAAKCRIAIQRRLPAYLDGLAAQMNRAQIGG